jgi:hypothetical protein
MPEQELPPSASAGILSLRAFDYDLSSALADLVDNSISAGARKVEISTQWAEMDSWIAVVDDGCGMTDKVLLEAMRLGSTSPSQVRQPHDLGRFGLGLKTASIWACRRLTVLSKFAGGTVCVRTWDVDRVVAENRWLVGDTAEGDVATSFAKSLAARESGTVVLWQKMDTLNSGGRREGVRTRESYNRDLASALRMLGVTFHRFIEKDKAPVVIMAGGQPVVPWNPTVSDPPPQQTSHKALLAFSGETVKVSTYVMPYSKNFASSTELQRAEGPLGWNAHQGFYVYRNDRLIVRGGWLGMFPSQDHYKLARVVVEIPNTLDIEVGISVTKTSVRLPEGLRADLEGEAKAARAGSVEVYRNRGRRVTAAPTKHQFAMPWQPFEKDGRFYYLLNKKHPLYERARDSAGDANAFSLMVSLIEQSLPYADIAIRNGERPESFPRPYEDTEASERKKILKEVYSAYLGATGTREKALEMISKTQPFSTFEEISEL